jgi:hypothetical protein
MPSDWSMNNEAIRNGHKPYDPDSEWQPGRLKKVHLQVEDPLFGEYETKERQNAMEEVVVLGRRRCAPLLVLVQYAEEGCDCDPELFWEIKPDSLRPIIGADADREPMFVCQHEFLTD